MCQPPSLGMARAEMFERYDRDRLGFLLTAARRYGPVVELAPGTIFVSGPPEVYDVLSRSNRDFLVSRNLLRKKVDGALGAEGTQRWMAARKVAARVLSDSALLEAHREYVRGATRGWLTRVLPTGKLTAGELMADLQTVASASISRYCFGDRDAREVPLRTQEMLDALLPVISSPFTLPGWLRVLPRDFAVRRAHRRLSKAVNDVMARPGRGGMYHELVSAGLTQADAFRIMFSALLAAHGVPSAAMAWMLVELACHPEVQTTLTDPGQREQLLGEVLRESLRLWPPSWSLTREAAADTQCAGWAIPRGAAIMISSWVVHRLAPSFADRPEAFVPGRWRTLRPERGEYLPFGAGPRWCVGERFALMELQVILDEVTAQAEVTIDIARDQVLANQRRTLTPEGFTLGFQARC
jgi:cytochrome P450